MAKEDQELRDETLRTLLQAIKDAAEAKDYIRVARFSEAYAWVISPAQPHGGGKSD